MQIKFSPTYAISCMTGQASDMLIGIEAQIIDAPALIGTLKQIVYANDIRDGAIRDMCQAAIKRGGPVSIETIERLNNQVTPIAAKLATITNAKTWIETNNGRKSLLTVQALLKS